MTDPTIPRLPSRPGRILLGGATIIGGIFAGTWFYMSTRQARKASCEPGEKGALPSWEYRMRQTVAPRGGGALSSPGTGTSSSSGIATTAAQQTRELRAQSLDAPNPDPPPDGDRSQSGTPSPGEEALRSPPESGAKTQPVPQHDPGDGLPYTERDTAGS